MEIVIAVTYRKREWDVLANEIEKSIPDIGIKKKVNLRTTTLYKLVGSLTKNEVKRIAEEFLRDSVNETYTILSKQTTKNIKVCDVWFKYGVTDVVGETVIRGIKDIGIKKKVDVKTGKRYTFEGNITNKDINTIAQRLLANTVIEKYAVI